MPNCFSLTPKGETRPQNLNSVDEALCKALGEPVSNTLWCRDWYNYIGLLLACGKTFDEIREVCCDSPEMLQVIDFLDAHYVSNAWYERR